MLLDTWKAQLAIQFVELPRPKLLNGNVNAQSELNKIGKDSSHISLLCVLKYDT
jgi:hypothetical protein